MDRLRSFGRHRGHPEPGRSQRVVPTMVVMTASRPFLLDVRDLTIGRELPVVTGDATAREIRKAEETDEAHHPEILLMRRQETPQTFASAAAGYYFCRKCEQFLYLNRHEGT